MSDGKVSTTTERLNEYMEITGEKQVEMLEKIKPVAKRCEEKFNKSHLSNYLSGRFTPKQNKIYVIAEGLNIDPAWLMGYDVPMRPKKEEPIEYRNVEPIERKTIPLIGEIACGTPIVANHEYEYIDVDSNVRADFAVIASGDSMIGARILDGDTVFIRSQPEVEDGEVAAVGIDDEVTLKRFYRKGDEVMLVAENPAYPPMVFRGEELDHIHILGKAVSFNSIVK